jgi:hypothetical protein
MTDERSPKTAAEKPAGLFAGLSESEVQKLWAQAQTLAALSLAQQAEAATDGR